MRSLNASGALTLLAAELSRLKWDIIGIAETHLLGMSDSRVDGYRLMNSGREERHTAGVGLLLSDKAQKTMSSYEQINERIIGARFIVQEGHCTVIQVYAPTAEACDTDIDEFYSKLQEEINRTPKNDICVVMGDFNAKIGVGDKDNEG